MSPPHEQLQAVRDKPEKMDVLLSRQQPEKMDKPDISKMYDLLLKLIRFSGFTI